MSTPILRLVQQRHDADCGVAVLATYCGASYEAALLAVGEIAPHVLEGGLWLSELQRGAKRLGVTLRRRRRFDLDSDEGIAHVSSKGWKRDHLVVVKAGLILDTDGSIWEHEDYVAHFEATVHLLLTAAE